MLSLPQRGLFVAGSDTEVGKTYVACQILRDLVRRDVKVAAYKPVASGCAPGGAADDTDAALLWEASQRRGRLDQVCPQRFKAPLAPHLAAEAEGRTVDVPLLSQGAAAWRDECDFLMVEGAGGLLSPLAPQTYNIDLVLELNYPLILVVANKIGAINQCLQALLTAANYGRGLAVAGIVLNQVSTDSDVSVMSNADEIRSRSDTPLLAELVHQGSLNGSAWDRFVEQQLVQREFDEESTGR